VEQGDERSSFACDRTRVRIAPGLPSFLLHSVWSIKDVRAAFNGARFSLGPRQRTARIAPAPPPAFAHLADSLLHRSLQSAFELG